MKKIINSVINGINATVKENVLLTKLFIHHPTKVTDFVQYKFFRTVGPYLVEDANWNTELVNGVRHCKKKKKYMLHS